MTLIPAPNRGLRPVWTLADRLRKSREAAGLEQIDLADVAGISRATISAAERGKREPSRATLAMWAMATGVSRSWLVDGIDSDTLETVRMNALVAIVSAARVSASIGHERAGAVLDAIAERERQVQIAGLWSASSAINHPEVLEWCEAFRPDLAEALIAAGNDNAPHPDGPDGGQPLPHLDSNQEPIG